MFFVLCLFVQKSFTEGFQAWNIIGCDIPNDTQLNFTVMVSNDIPHSLDLLPVHFHVCFTAKLVGKTACQFTDLKNAESNNV